jgi:hypothetical protein
VRRLAPAQLQRYSGWVEQCLSVVVGEEDNADGLAKVLVRGYHVVVFIIRWSV